jgi:acyl-coenzyme A synthetase/AMP-(fatty) acid ligase
VNDPQLTREYFIELHSTASQSTRVYRTGDLGRWNHQGKLEFHGRIDHQVKINGFRIEVQEIESAIRRLPGITDVDMAGVVGPSNQKRLYAFFGSFKATTQQIRRAWLIAVVRSPKERFSSIDENPLKRHARHRP